jgi:hypothetical protein
VADTSDVVVQRFLWRGDRLDNKRASASAALELLVERAATAARGFAR